MNEEIVKGIGIYFAEVEDPRRAQGTRHILLEIIIMALCGVICHADSWPEVEEFAQTKAAWLSQFLKLPHGVPTEHTFRRVFAALDPEQVQTGFIKWVAKVEEITEGEVVAVDGKTLRRAFSNDKKKGAIHMVNAWASRNNLVLGQLKVEDKSNEITAIPRLLDLLTLKGRIVTIDAMGCQREIAEKIIEKEGDYLFALKQNQGNLYADVVHLFDYAQPTDFAKEHMDYAMQVNKGHGRVEKRECWVIADPQWLNLIRHKANWSQLQTLVKVRSQRSIDDKRRKPKIRYYISSLPSDAKHILTSVRTHWEVENKLHWVLDVAFREDESRLHTGHGQENMAALRCWALNLIRQDKTTKGSINRKRLKAGWDNNYLQKLIFQI